MYVGQQGWQAGAHCTAGIATAWLRGRRMPKHPQPVVLATMNMAAQSKSNLFIVLFRVEGGEG